MRALAPVCLFLVIWTSKVFVIERYGTDVPYWDQWPGEAAMTFIPWLEEKPPQSYFFVPHNEHRIVPTRLWSLTLLILTGQWDARVQCVANAALHAGLAVALFVWARKRLTAGWSFAFGVLLACAAGTPIPWEDVLGGFQSQYYFLIGFSLFCIYALLQSRISSPWWWCGLFAGGISLVTMASGLFSAATVALFAALRLVLDRSNRLHAGVTLGAAISLLIIGILLHAPTTHHDFLRAKSLAQLLEYSIRCLSWPMPTWPWLFIVFWTPWLGASLLWLRSKQLRTDPAFTFVAAAGVWTLFQTLALGFSRGGGSELPSPRYGDVTGLGVTIGFLALGLLAPRYPHRLTRVAAAVYLLAMGVAGYREHQRVWREVLPNKLEENRTYENNVQAFMLTNDESHLVGQTIPFPWPEWLRDLLRNPKIPPILPSSIRRPIEIHGFSLETPAGVKPLDFRRIRVVRSGEEWKSPVIPVTPGWWKIETSGDIGMPGTSLQIVNAADGRVYGEVAPSKPAGNSWRAAYVKAPTEPSVIVAKITETGKWLGFSEPVEMSSLSYWTWKMAKYSNWVWLASIVSLIGALSSPLATRRKVLSSAPRVSDSMLPSQS